MSRCFPFPPPGFERPPEVCGTNTLTKASPAGEGERKKEKRRKEKKGHKERDGGGKKKEKERKRKKEKKSEDGGGGGHLNGVIDESMLLEELERRIRSDGKAAMENPVEWTGGAAVVSRERCCGDGGEEKRRREEKANRKEERAKKKAAKVKRREERVRKRGERARRKEERERKREEKASVKVNGFAEGRLKEMRNGFFVHPPCPSRETSSSVGSNQNHRKRKDIETNGLPHEHDCELPMAKALRTAEEGRALVMTSSLILPNAQGSSSPILANWIGPIPPRLPSPPMWMPVSPHPDAKRLETLLNIVPVEPSGGEHDDCWLHVRSRRTRVPLPHETTPFNVWSEAIRIESADITILPYVIPY